MHSVKVLLVEDNKADALLEQTLLDDHYSITQTISPPSTLTTLKTSAKPDVVIFNTGSPTENILNDIRQINRVFPLPIIIFSSDSDRNTIANVIKAGVSAYVVDDIRTKKISTVIEIAIARFNEHKSLKDELEKTRNKLEERKLTDRAKGILIKTRGFSEDEAYHTLRKLAMDRNIPISEMAKNVISMAELLK
ncbi:MAG: ANTAR domain-containing response regulator [Gammaproteobacteria bacterium]